MSFFEPPPSPELPPEPPTPAPWVQPPQNEVGSGVPLEPLVIYRGDEVALAVTGIVAYSSGFEFDLSVRRRSGEDDELFNPAMHPRLYGRHAAGELPDELLRFGIEFADGRKATNVGRHPGMSGDEPEGPTLLERGGSGGGNRWDQTYWVWPLPPAGTLAFVCEWPHMNVPLTRREIEAAMIIDAAAGVVVLWPSERSRSATGAWVGGTHYAVAESKSAPGRKT